MKKAHRAVVLLLVAALAPLVAAPLARAEDPCADRAPTELDRRGDWRCVGLATYADPEAEPRDGGLTDEQARRLDVTRPASWELGVAVSPDGRLYRQTAPSPTGPDQVRPVNPTPPDADPEGEPQPTGTGQSAGTGQLAGTGQVGEVGTRTVFGPDDRVLRLSTTNYPWRVMGSVSAPGSTTSNCSGSLIGPRHFLTAGHCIHVGGTGADAGWYPDREVAPGQRGIGTYPNGLKDHSWYFSVVGWFDHADPAYDYGMIVLQDLPSTAGLGWLGWRSSGHWGGHWTFGYPGWSHACAASPSPGGLCDNYLYGDDNSTQLVLAKQIKTHADAQTGQSGSPIYQYNGGDRRVIAVLAYHGNWGTRVTGARSDNFCAWIHAFPSAFNDHPCE
ncbi:trypsin-like serine peptidase [Saccharothrix syringae]|uniref:Serine protease n=1 Tax=Saccharothrix syringae TaxID=103733 RepID=A0A5Q0H5X3_SACSY|nr:trypsin-like serine protease [Saccharothrix syringae]QFZ21250.1 trypsin-like serine protease [Saccharothrix syringae]